METFTSFDGTAIAFREWGAEYGTVPVVLHHGFAADSLTNWVTPGVADRICALGRRVVAIDARGHGKSDKPHDVAAYRDGQMVRDVSCLIDHLEVERIDFVGYSMGGHVALDVATTETRLRSVVVAGIGGYALAPESIDRSAMVRALRAESIDDVSDGAGRALRRLAERSGADLEALAAVATNNGHRAEHLERITVPALVLVGADDPLARGSERLAATIPGARHQVVPGDHLGAVAEPAFAEAISNFLTEVSARS
ncbi:MAG: alpha/beta fold hydrolase [Ilumatobacteraceae bacterium]